MSSDERAVLLEKLTTYVRDELLGEENSADLTSTTPLLEWGVLDSMKMARLLAYIREELGVRVPSKKMIGDHFKNLKNITELVLALRKSTV